MELAKKEQEKNEQEKKRIETICSCLEKFENVQFAYLYSPLADYEAESDADLDIAIAVTPCFDDEELFQTQQSLLNELSFVLHTQKVFLVVCNRCSRDYQYLVFRTGQLIFNRNDNLLEHFIESFKWVAYFEEYVASYKSRKARLEQAMRDKLAKMTKNKKKK